MRTMSMKELGYCIDVLELPRTVANLLDAHSHEELRKGLERLKNLVGKQRRKLAMKCHSDVTGGDESRMKAINGAADFVESLQVIGRNPVRHIVHYGGWFGDASTTSARFSFGADFHFGNLKRFFDDAG